MEHLDICGDFEYEYDGIRRNRCKNMYVIHVISLPFINRSRLYPCSASNPIQRLTKEKHANPQIP